MNKFLRTFFAVGWCGAAMVAGCSLIVTSDVEDVKCVSTTRSSCPLGMVCDLTAGKCVADAGAVVEEDSGDEDVVEPTDVVTTDVVDGATIGAPGSPCRIDSDCKSRLCGTSAHLTTPITATTGPICTTPCCTSLDCPSSFVCFNGGTGGGYCVPGKLAQRTVPATGGKAAGALCSGHGECRSGLCDQRCLDTCCAANDCAAGSVCRLKTVSLLAAATPTHVVWVCAAPPSPGNVQAGNACTTQEQCTTELCLPAANGSCRPPCSGTAACKTITQFENGVCIYGQDSSGDQFKYCLKTPSGAKANGAACNDRSECESAFCDLESKKCAAVCAKGSDCAGNEECRPLNGGTPFLRCVPKP